MFKQKDGSIKKAIVEIKPDVQTRPPVKPKRMTQRFLTEVKTYAVNTAKWRAAEAYAKQLGVDFLILTEHELGIK